MPVSVSERRAICWALAFMALASMAHAEGVGLGDRARSALGRVGVPAAGEAGKLALAAELNGGVTESLSSSDAAHARFGTKAAVAVDAARFLNFGALVSGRYDLHPRDARGKDDGFVFQSELSARLAWRLGALGLGVEGAAWLPGGSDVGSSFSALGADGKLLLSGHTGELVVAGFGGYRLDRSAKAAGEPERLRFGDRSALGASDYDAVLAGLGAGYLMGRTTLFGEAAAQLLLGSPKMSASPIWVTVGVRSPLGSSGLSAELSLDALASARPDVSATAPLFPIEPRVMLHAGLRYRFGEQAAPVAPVAKPVRAAPPPDVAKPAPQVVTTVELVLNDERGQPLARARVGVTQGDNQLTLVETEPGHYRLEGAQPGPAKLHIQADGFKPVERDLEVGGAAPLRLAVQVEPALPAGQVRGVVRSFRGKALSASIHVEPGGAETKTDPDGFFQIDVPPGEYEVVIESPGFEPQRRKAKVDQQGVVIVNADLVKRP